MTYETCTNCNSLLTEEFVNRYGRECADCHKPLGVKLYEAFGR